MSIVISDIAEITEPEEVTLSGRPNFVQFASKESAKRYTMLAIYVQRPASSFRDSESELRILNSVGDTLVAIAGTRNPAEVGGATYYIHGSAEDIASNMQRALLSDGWFNAHFDAYVPLFESNGTYAAGYAIYVKSKGAGEAYNIRTSPGDWPRDNLTYNYFIEWPTPASSSGDSLSGEAGSVDIELDIYSNPHAFLHTTGGGTKGTDYDWVVMHNRGNLILTLSKTYSGKPLWFDLNAIWRQYGGYNTPRGAPGWFNAGTVQAYQFAARLNSLNSTPFYYSSPVFALNGDAPLGEAADLSGHVLDLSEANGSKPVKLLTNKPVTTLMRGQREYLNFLMADKNRRSPGSTNQAVVVGYAAYTAGGAYLGTVWAHRVQRTALAMANTCVLDVDLMFDRYPGIGVLRVALYAEGAAYGVGGVRLTEEAEYTVLPGCLHQMRQFTFLNSLGGWDNWNADAGTKVDVKPEVVTYEKTITPAWQRGDSVETVYSATLAEVTTVEAAPVTDAVAAWLRELASSKAVLDQDGNYIVIEDFTLQVMPSNKNLHRPTIKYRISK